MRIEGHNPEDLFGWSVAAGDTDGDGVGELAVVAEGWYGADERGAVFLFPWPGEGSFDAIEAPYAWRGGTASRP